MHNVSLGKKRLMRVHPVLAFFVSALLALPFPALATTVLPAQVLPPATGKACAPVTYSDIRPYVYDGNLDSFDITVSDASYIAVTTSVQGSAVPYNYLTRWINPDGSLRLHVDLASIRMNANVPVHFTLLSAQKDTAGLPVTCLINIDATIGAIPGLQAPESNPNHVYIPITQPSGTNSGTHATSSTSTTSVLPEANMGLVAATHSLGKLCINGGAARLWVILLVLYALFVITLSAQKIEPGDLGREWNIALILGIFLALLIFWYVSSVCRAGPWAPALATLIAVAGLVYTMMLPEPQGILLLKDHNKK